MHYQNITYVKDDHVCSLILGRPEPSAPFDPQMAAEIEDACHRIRQDPGIRVALVTGPAMSPPYDAANRSAPPESASTAYKWEVPNMIAAIECPVVVAIVGDAWDTGLALALAGDLRVASNAATFGVQAVTLGHFPLGGLTQRLPRAVGPGKAVEMLISGAPVGAAEALRIGLVHRLAPSAEVADQARNLAQEMAARAPIALRYVKEAIRKGMDLTLEQGLRLECDLYMILQTTQDRVEGITAFRDKKPPAFQGR